MNSQFSTICLVLVVVILQNARLIGSHCSTSVSKKLTKHHKQKVKGKCGKLIKQRTGPKKLGPWRKRKGVQIETKALVGLPFFYVHRINVVALFLFTFESTYNMLLFLFLFYTKFMASLRNKNVDTNIALKMKRGRNYQKEEGADYKVGDRKLILMCVIVCSFLFLTCSVYICSFGESESKFNLT